jgi:hypothetical protein
VNVESARLPANFLDLVGTEPLLPVVSENGSSVSHVPARRPDLELVNFDGTELTVRDIGDNEFWIIAFDINDQCLGCGIIRDFVSTHIVLHSLSKFSSFRSFSVEELFNMGENK